jgi:acetylornithine deacetylase
MDPAPAEPFAEEEYPQGAYGGARPSPPDLLAPPDAAFDGRGEMAPPRAAEPAAQELEILAAVQSQAGFMEDLLVALIDAPTLLGNEGPGQDLMRYTFGGLGLQPVDVPMDADALRAHPGSAPFDWDVRGKSNVVATWQPAEPRDGRSLILNGHVDVVSPEPLAGWTKPPFMAVRDEDWIYGRGAADMKCGLAAIAGAVRGLRALGVRPRAPVHLESVVEEECSGNGTLSCVMAGYTADAGIVAEPFGAAITVSQVGVLWFHVVCRGVPVHAAEERRGINAIEKSFEVMQALRGLEAELNLAPPPPYERFGHPINLNVGAIKGGDWASTVPGECVTSYRIALYPGMKVRDLQDRIEAVVAEAAVEDRAIFENPPEVRYSGFTSEGYDIPDDHPMVQTLAGAFARQSGQPPALVATTGTTDAGILARFGDTPSVCFGPYAEQAHAADERVWFPSVVQTAQVMALFIRDWCGLSS